MSKDKVVETKEITISVGLDDSNMPVHMEWTTEGKTQEIKGMLLSVFDKEYRDTYKVDLWTMDMQIQEMDRLFYQTLRGMADTYFTATKNNKLASEMRQFVEYFGEQSGALPKEN